MDDGDAGFIIRRLDVCNQTPLEAGLQPFLQQIDLLGRSVGGQDDLLVCLVQRVEGVEEFFLCAVLAGDKLDVINEKNVGGAVFVAEFLYAGGLNRVDQLVGEVFALDIDDAVVGMAAAYRRSDGVQQVVLPSPD